MIPLISVIIPCYNQAEYLYEALQSVLNQSYKHWECIIVNDGSSDDTEKIAKEWLDKDTRFKYVYKDNGGLSSARNAGLSIATGDYIQFLDSDDLLGDKKFEISMDSFMNYQDLDVVITNYNMILGRTSQKKDPFFKLQEVTFNFDTIVNKWDIDFTIPIHCAVFKISSIAKIKFNENLKAKEDWLFWIQFFKGHPNVLFVNKKLVSYRKHASSMTQSAPYMLDSQNIVLDFIKQELTLYQYERFLFERLMFYKERYLNISSKYSKLKNSLTYRFALKQKKILVELGLLVVVGNMLKKMRK